MKRVRGCCLDVKTLTLVSVECILLAVTMSVTCVLRMSYQVAALEANVLKSEKMLAHAKSELTEESNHRQDLQQRVVESEGKFAALNKEKQDLIKNNSDLQEQRDARQKQIERLQRAEEQAKVAGAQVQKKLSAANLELAQLQVVPLAVTV